jgi:dynein heavy chain
LVVQLSDFKKQLKELEAKILKLVGEAGDDILDDEELIVTLDQSNETSITIKQKVEEAEQTAITINESREGYRSVARRGSILYFVIADLGLIDPMYQYSLDFFGKLFNRRLDKSKKSEDLEERIEILLADLTESFYTNICRGLFEAHKLLYAYLNATAIAKRAGDIAAKEWHVYLRGSTTVFERENKCDYISDDVFEKLLGLEEAHEAFEGLASSFEDDVDAVIWKDLMLSDNPINVKLPPALEDKLNIF